MLPADFHLTLTAHFEGRTLLGGEPFAIVRPLRARGGADPRVGGRATRWARTARSPARSCARTWRSRCPPRAPRRRSAWSSRSATARSRALLAALDVDDVIVVDDASATRTSCATEAAGVRYVRRERAGRRGRGPQRRPGGGAPRARRVHRQRLRARCRAGSTRCSPHFADPELSAVAPRIVALERVVGEPTSARGRGAGAGVAPGRARAALPLRARPLAARPRPRPRARHPLRAGAVRARAALVVRRHLRFDATLRGGEDVEFVWRVPYVRYEPAAQVAHDHRTDPRAWLARRVYYGRTAAGIAKRHPGKARPLHVSPWTTAAWVALAARRPLDRRGDHRRRDRAAAREVDPPDRRAELAGARQPAVRPRRRRRAHPRLVAARRVAAARDPARAAPARRRARDQDAAPARRRPRVRDRPLAGLPRSSARSTRCCPPGRGRLVRARSRSILAAGRRRQMGRHRGLARSPRSIAFPFQSEAADARLRRERRVPGPRRRVDAGRRAHRHPLHGRQRDHRGDPLHARRPLTQPTWSGSRPTRMALCNPQQIPDIVRVITPVQLACGELPPITPPQSSTIKPTSEDQTTQLVTVWTSDDATETVVRDVADDARRSARRRGMRAYVTGEAGFAADQAAALEGIDETLLAVTLALVLVLLLLIYRTPIVALVPVVRRRDRLPRRRGARLRGREGRPLPGHRPGDGDPDRPDVRRGHRLLPAAARALPRGARQAGRDGDRAAGAPRPRSSPRAGSSSW